MKYLLEKRFIRRAMTEHRLGVIALGVLLLLNVLGYVVVVYPLSQRVNNVTSLTSAAERELSAARVQFAQASNLVTGRATSAQKLETFYRDVLPPDATTARRITAPRLYQLARQAGVHPDSLSLETETERDHILTRLDLRMNLTGTYDDVREFIHLLERAPEFIAVVNMRVADNSEDGGELSAQLELATYYKGAAR